MSSGDYVAWSERPDDEKILKDSWKDEHIEESVRHVS
jgi:hypothetical protein